MKSASCVCMCRYTFCMKLVIWLAVIAAIAVLVYGIVKWRRRREELEQASEQRTAAFMAEMMAATKAKATPAVDARSKALPAVDALAKATPAVDALAKAAPAVDAMALAKQKMLFDAAAKAGEAGEPVLSIQLYARLLARYPDTAFAALAREAVEAQKKNLPKT